MKKVTVSVRSRFGFTLVELMVVISVIGILSAIVYASFGSSRAIARDNIRKTDLKNLQVAIALYKAQNGHYPSACDDVTANLMGNVTDTSHACSVSGAPYIKDLIPDYIATLPQDPKAGSYGSNSMRGYLYRVNSTGSDYKLVAYDVVESLKIKNQGDDFARCPTWSGGNECDGSFSTGHEETSYAVYSAGASGW
jgi:type II secretion system protein G